MKATLLHALQVFAAAQRRRAQARGSPPLPFIFVDCVHDEGFIDTKLVSLRVAEEAALCLTTQQFEQAAKARVVLVIVADSLTQWRPPSSPEKRLRKLQRRHWLAVFPMAFL